METWWHPLTQVHLENGLNGQRDFGSNNCAVKGAAVTQWLTFWVLFQMRSTKSLLVNIRQGIWSKLLLWRLVTLAFSAPYKCCYLLTYLLTMSEPSNREQHYIKRCSLSCSVRTFMTLCF